MLYYIGIYFIINFLLMLSLDILENIDGQTRLMAFCFGLPLIILYLLFYGPFILYMSSVDFIRKKLNKDKIFFH
jgi:hypothetical protein